MNTPCRSSFHHRLVARSGARRSTSRASANAARRTSGKVQRCSMRTLTWMLRERFPDDERDTPDLVPRHARDGVEVHPQLVGMVEVLGTHRVRVEVDAT